MANCIHGFPKGQCLICSTLARTPGNATAVADKPGSSVQLDGLNGGPVRALPGPKLGQAKAAADEKPHGRGSAKSKLAVAVVVIVAGILAWGLFQGIFDLALRIAEYVVLAVAAGWVGYKAGHYQARREAERDKRHPRAD